MIWNVGKLHIFQIFSQIDLLQSYIFVQLYNMFFFQTEHKCWQATGLTNQNRFDTFWPIQVELLRDGGSQAGIGTSASPEVVDGFSE